MGVLGIPTENWRFKVQYKKLYLAYSWAMGMRHFFCCVATMTARQRDNATM